MDSLNSAAPTLASLPFCPIDTRTASGNLLVFVPCMAYYLMMITFQQNDSKQVNSSFVVVVAINFTLFRDDVHSFKNEWVGGFTYLTNSSSYIACSDNYANHIHSIPRHGYTS